MLVREDVEEDIIDARRTNSRVGESQNYTWKGNRAHIFSICTPAQNTKE